MIPFSSFRNPSRFPEALLYSLYRKPSLGCISSPVISPACVPCWAQHCRQTAWKGQEPAPCSHTGSFLSGVHQSASAPQHHNRHICWYGIRAAVLPLWSPRQTHFEEPFPLYLWVSRRRNNRFCRRFKLMGRCFRDIVSLWCSYQWTFRNTAMVV